MKVEDLQFLTRDELNEIFVDLINQMESKGNQYYDEYKKDEDRLEFYCMSAALLTRVNYIKGKVKVRSKSLNV